MTDYYFRDIKTDEDKIHLIIKLLVQTYSSAVLRAVSVLYGRLMTLEKNQHYMLKPDVKASWVRSSRGGVL